MQSRPLPAGGARLHHHLGQTGRIQKTQVSALPGQRMNIVGGVTDQRQTRLHILLDVAMAERKSGTRTDQRDCAQLVFKRLFQRPAESGFIERQHRRHAVFRQRPDDRAVAIHQRQKCQRPVRRKTLPRRFGMWQLGGHAANNRLLVIRQTLKFNTRGSPHLRARTIRADNQTAFQCAPILQM